MASEYHHRTTWRDDNTRNALGKACAQALHSLSEYRSHADTHPVGKTYAQVCIDATRMLESMITLKMQAGATYIFRTDLQTEGQQRTPSIVSKTVLDVRRVLYGFRVSTHKQTTKDGARCDKRVAENVIRDVDALLNLISATRFD